MLRYSFSRMLAISAFLFFSSTGVALSADTILSCGQDGNVIYRSDKGELLKCPDVPFATNAEKLSAYNVNLAETTVSGISSGAYAAHQMFVAHSKDMAGVGIWAGGPYYCALFYRTWNIYPIASNPGIESAGDGWCRDNKDDRLNAFAMPKIIQETKAQSGVGIDPIDHINGKKIFVFSGMKDEVVNPTVAKSIRPMYDQLGLAPQFREVFDKNVGHSMPNPDYGVDCTADVQPPYISKCTNYDGPGDMFKFFYGSNIQRTDLSQVEQKGRYIKFDQSEFISSGSPVNGNPKIVSMDTEGYAYVPEACENGANCKLHVFLHGCFMNVKDMSQDGVDNAKYNEDESYDRAPFGDPTKGASANKKQRYGLQSVKYAGLNQWAAANNVIVLYPQFRQSTGGAGTGDGYKTWLAGKTENAGGATNPHGCADFWGYSGGNNSFTSTTAAYDPNYHTKNGLQLSILWKMVERVASGNTGPTEPPPPPPPAGNVPSAPTGLTVSSTSDNSIGLIWTPNPEPSVTGYNLYLVNGGSNTKMNSGLITSTQFTLGGLTSNATYTFVVRAVNTVGESSNSAQASATTNGTQPPPPPPPPQTDEPPAAPNGLSANAIQTTSISLSWANNSESDLRGYNVYVSSGGSFVRNNNGLVGASQYTVSGLAQGTNYSFYVTAVDAALNESAISNTISVTTNSDPLPPPPPPQPEPEPSQCVTAKNSEHMAAGRAHKGAFWWWFAYTDGTSQLMGGYTGAFDSTTSLSAGSNPGDWTIVKNCP